MQRSLPVTDNGRRAGAAVSDVLVIADTRSRAERDRVAAWARREHPDARVLGAHDAALARALDAGDDPLLVPARVSWLPNGDRPGIEDLLLLADPAGPLGRVQRALARRMPHRGRVISGEPARAEELRRRFRAETGRRGGGELAAFVRRQATLANDRAERAVAGDQYKVPRLVAEQILASQRVRERVGALAAQLERPPEEVLAEVADALGRLATVQSPLGEQLYRIALSPLHARAWNVNVDAEGLERLREANRRHAIVFLPSHRSYADPLVLNQVLHDHRFPRNHVLGGDNMAFGPFSALGRRAGVVFIRRSFGSDPAYKLAVREYLGHLVAKRFNLEWYLEGGRTRTGKLRPPRLGLLRYLSDALDDGRADDVVLVPTSIVYDQLHEVGAIAGEQGGGRKAAEGWPWLLRYVRAQRRNVGTAHVCFGEPFLLREALAEAGEGESRLPKVAFRICDGINRATPATMTSLVGFALLGAARRALTFAQLRAELAPLLDYLGADHLRRPDALRGGLAALVAEGVLDCFSGGTEPVWSIAPGRHHEAAFYRNGALHHLVRRAIVELSVASADLHEQALRLRDLLKFEFFFPEKERFLREVDDELDRLRREPRPRVAERVLRPFVEAQYVVALRLAARDPRAPVERAAFTRECTAVGRQLVLQGRLRSPESVSRELYSAAVRLAANRDLIDPGREAVRAARQEFLTEIEDVLEELDVSAG